MPRTVLVTGGASGLGRGFTESLLEQGAKVVIVDYSVQSGIDAANTLNEQYGSGSVLFIQCDVSNASQFERAFALAVKVYGQVDVLVNNAGIGTHENFERLVDINLNAVIRGCELASNHMRTDLGGKGGSIINISSTAGLTVAPFEVVYAATKHGVVGLSRSLGVALEGVGVNVMCLCPSFTNTALFRSGAAIQSDDPNNVVSTLGIMEVPDVVRAFDKLLADHHPASVMAVTPKGFEYKFPRSLKPAKL